VIIPDDIKQLVSALMEHLSAIDQYFDLKGLERYSAIRVPTLRDHIKSGSLPAFKVKGKVLVKKSEFDQWVERYRVSKNQDLNNLVDDILSDMSG